MVKSKSGFETRMSENVHIIGSEHSLEFVFHV